MQAGWHTHESGSAYVPEFYGQDYTHVLVVGSAKNPWEQLFTHFLVSLSAK